MIDDPRSSVEPSVEPDLDADLDLDTGLDPAADPLRAVVPFEQALAGLLASADPAAERPWLQALSNARADDVVAWRRAAAEAPAERRLQLARALKARADDDFYVNYKPLFIALLDDPAPAVRATAIGGLWEATEPRLLDRYAELLAHDLDPAVRAAAAEAIGPYIERAELDALDRSRVAPALELVLAAAADTAAPLALRCAAVASAGWSETAAAGAVVATALAGPQPALVAAGLVAVGRSADDGWAADVLAHLGSAEPTIQAAAAYAAGALGLRAAVAPLARVAQDAPTAVRRAAIEALGEIGGYRAVLALEALAESEVDDGLVEVIDHAAEAAALGELDTDVGAPAGAADDDDIVGWLRDHGAADELDGWIDDEDEDEVEDAVSLGRALRHGAPGGDDDSDDADEAAEGAPWPDDEDEIDREAWAWDEDER